MILGSSLLTQGSQLLVTHICDCSLGKGLLDAKIDLLPSDDRITASAVHRLVQKEIDRERTRTFSVALCGMVKSGSGDIFPITRIDISDPLMS